MGLPDCDVGGAGGGGMGLPVFDVGGSAGAASAMVVMAEAFGADARLVAFMQYLRVVCVVAVARHPAAKSRR